VFFHYMSPPPFPQPIPRAGLILCDFPTFFICSSHPPMFLPPRSLRVPPVPLISRRWNFFLKGVHVDSTMKSLNLRWMKPSSSHFPPSFSRYRKRLCVFFPFPPAFGRTLVCRTKGLCHCGAFSPLFSGLCRGEVRVLCAWLFSPNTSGPGPLLFRHLASIARTLFFSDFRS